jgi:hypothetical protein
VKRNESLGGKGVRNLTPLGRVDDSIGERAGVSRDTVRKVIRILESASDKTKEDLRLGKININEACVIIELDQECQSFYQKYVKALEELKKSSAEIDNRPVRTEEEIERLRAQGKEKLVAHTIKPFRNYFEKGLELLKAYAAFYFWLEYRANKNSDIEFVSNQTLKEIVSLGIKDEMQTLPCRAIEEILHHALAENRINGDIIKNSKVIRAQLELIRREEEA